MKIRGIRGCLGGRDFSQLLQRRHRLACRRRGSVGRRRNRRRLQLRPDHVIFNRAITVHPGLVPVHCRGGRRERRPAQKTSHAENVTVFARSRATDVASV